MVDKSQADLKIQVEIQNDPQIEQSKQNSWCFKESRNSIICLFQILFKGYCIVANILGFALFDDTIVVITIILASAFDFWTVKNVCGRILVGLFWTTEFDEDGKQTWHYISKDEQNSNSFDKSLFWTSQFGCMVYWSLIGIVNLFSFSILFCMLDIFVASLLWANFIQFIKCSKEQQQKIKNLQNNIIQQGAKQMVGQMVKQQKQ